MTTQVEQQVWKDAAEFKDHAQRWATEIGVSPRRIQIQHMSKKWASCSPLGTITFSTDLLDESREFGEAVIVHELLHLIAPNHGRLFRGLYSSYMPNWQEIVGDRAVCGAFRG